MTHGTLNPAAAGPEATRKLLDQLWERNLPALHSRLALFDAVAEAARTHVLTPELREQAAAEAHKLAGSLGMFGYHNGTVLARELEVLLEEKSPETPRPDPTRIAELATTLRSELGQ